MGFLLRLHALQIPSPNTAGPVTETGLCVTGKRGQQLTDPKAAGREVRLCLPLSVLGPEASCVQGRDA